MSDAQSRRWTLVATILGSSLTFIDGTVVTVALPALQRGLHATLTDVQWVIEAYAWLLGSLTLVGGALGDQVGRKRAFLAGVVVFALASIGCGLATSTRMLIVARATQGIGAAFLVPGSLAIISATFDGADRGRAIGTWSGFSAITSAIGPVLGGWLIDHVSWRAVFFLNVPLAAVVVALSWRYMRESRDRSRTGAIDWLGAGLAVLALGGIVFALLEWPRTDANRTAILAMLMLGLLSLVSFIVVESRVARPMLPLGVFRSRRFTFANLLTFFLYSALALVFWLVPLNLIQVQHFSATAAGSALLPFPLLMFSLSRWSGGLSRRVGSRLPLTIGPIVAAAGLALFARIAIDGSYWTRVFPAVVVLGLGMAIVVAPLTDTAMTAVTGEHAGVASGVNNAVARLAGLIAIAVFGIVLVETFDRRVSNALDRLDIRGATRSAINRELPKMAGAEIETPLDVRQRTAVGRAIDESFLSAFDVVMVTAAGVALAAAVAGARIREESKPPARASSATTGRRDEFG